MTRTLPPCPARRGQPPSARHKIAAALRELKITPLVPPRLWEATCTRHTSALARCGCAAASCPDDPCRSRARTRERESTVVHSVKPERGLPVQGSALAGSMRGPGARGLPAGSTGRRARLAPTPRPRCVALTRVLTEFECWSANLCACRARAELSARLSFSTRRWPRGVAPTSSPRKKLAIADRGAPFPRLDWAQTKKCSPLPATTTPQLREQQQQRNSLSGLQVASEAAPKRGVRGVSA